MTYLPYVIAAYIVFADVLGWDFVAPRIDIARQLRAAKLRAARATAARPAPDATLSRTESE